jgi:anthranilate synthase component I
LWRDPDARDLHPPFLDVVVDHPHGGARPVTASKATGSDEGHRHVRWPAVFLRSECSLVQPPFDIAADLDTPVSAYRKLGAFGPVFLLESVEGGQRIGRYSFIGLGAASSVRLDADGLSVDGGAPVAVQGRDELLGALRGAVGRTSRLRPEVPGLPFDGGLVGAIGYDFVRRLERLPAHAAARPGEPELAMVSPRSLLVFDHMTRRVALLHDGPEWERLSLRREIIAALRGPHPASPARSGHEPPTPSLSEGEFIAAVERVKEHIRAGDVFQLVLSVRFSGECRTSPFEVYRALRMLNPSPYMYFLDLGGMQVVGSSPEALVRLEGRTASLRPIAGTRRRGADEADDARLEQELLADEKESAEHVMLVDLARNDLGRVARPGSVRVEPYRSIERYSHVMHIVSGVRGELAEGADALDLFAAAFPAGTVSGAPKIRAMQIIDELEPVRRGLYAGTVGYFARSGNMDQAIAIRTLVFRDGMYSYQAGAGIVADSDPEAEHREVMAKVGALQAALALAGEGL